jgi:molybdopterin-guanine dinucleotide biosynthesis protein A
MVNANRHLTDYAAFHVPVCSDTLPDYAGPLAGFATALQHCTSAYLMTVACDTPHFPHDLVVRLALALNSTDSDIAMPTTSEVDPNGRSVVFKQPVFCLMRRTLLPDLESYMATGGRKIDAWTGRHKTALVAFNDAEAFYNINSLQDLQAQRP